MPEFQENWENLPVDFSGYSDQEIAYAEFMYEEGFMKYSGEAPPEDIAFARQEFFDALGIDEDQFDWEGWREAMGYE